MGKLIKTAGISFTKVNLKDAEIKAGDTVQLVGEPEKHYKKIKYVIQCSEEEYNEIKKMQST